MLDGCPARLHCCSATQREGNEVHMEEGSEILQDNCTVDLTHASAKFDSCVEEEIGVSTTPAIPTVLGTPNDADRLSGAGMAEGNRGNRNLGGRRPEVVQEMELQKVKPNLVEAKSISDLKQGNGINSTLDLVQWDEKKFSRWMKNCDEWDFVALDDRLGIRNPDMQPLDVDDNVGTRQIESMMMKQHLVSAHEVFERMSEQEMVDVDTFIGLLNTPRGVCRSIDSCSSFVFDPGKGFAFPLHIESAIDDFIEVLNTLGDDFGSVQSRSFLFDPGKHFELSLHTTSCCCITHY